MPISRGNITNYVLANGRIEFNQFPIENGVEDKTKAKGFRYLGASTEFNLTQENETLEHKSSECGFNTTDEEIIISNSMTGNLTLDNINTENLALFFAGEISKVAQNQQAAQTEVLQVFPRLGYRLGVTAANPNGVFSATVTKVETFASKQAAQTGNLPTATLVADTDYEVAHEAGYLMMGETDKIPEEGIWVKVTYSLAQATREVIISKGQSIVGALMFRGCNAKGENRTYYMPRVRLSPSGDFALKGGEEWSTMGFDVTVLKDNELPMLYINGQPRV